ncbi:hypothetical protein THAOC_07943, partial [Thalassiosira oceanica]
MLSFAEAAGPAGLRDGTRGLPPARGGRRDVPRRRRAGAGRRRRPPRGAPVPLGHAAGRAEPRRAHGPAGPGAQSPGRDPVPEHRHGDGRPGPRGADPVPRAVRRAAGTGACRGPRTPRKQGQGPPRLFGGPPRRAGGAGGGRSGPP